MLFINQEQVKQMLSMEKCITIMEKVLVDLSNGETVQPLRTAIPVNQNNLLGLMPGILKKEEVVGTKLITIFPENHKEGLPSHQGVVIIFDAKDGKMKAVVDGSEITAIRTAAASAVATNYLANPHSEVLTIIGTGEQARTHLEAMLLIRPIKKVNVWSKRQEKARQFKKEMEEKHGVEITIFHSVEEAVQHADIICTVTSSTVPILDGSWVKKGAHVNAVGACRPMDRELDSDLVKNAHFYVDRLESAVNESGDYLIPLKEGVIDETHILGEIGDVIKQTVQGRQAEDNITIFESLGLAVEDLAVAEFLYQEASIERENVEGE
ncbi:ornithine cyclodeaminase family protein [Bacillus spongiae]|uniref:Ornithine cyclodeaminase family protein n=1 Tax=Bacillus spongiae TaxID=2683610 RepID=A0ABU8HCA6_9BACI